MKISQTLLPLLLLVSTVSLQCFYAASKKDLPSQGTRDIIARLQRATQLKRDITTPAPELSALMNRLPSGLNFAQIVELIDRLETRRQNLTSAYQELAAIPLPLQAKKEQWQYVQQAQIALVNIQQISHQLAQAQQRQAIQQQEMARLLQASGFNLPQPTPQGLTNLGATQEAAPYFDKFFSLVLAISTIKRNSGQTPWDALRDWANSILNHDINALNAQVQQALSLQNVLDYNFIAQEYGASVNFVFTLLNNQNQTTPGSLLIYNELVMLVNFLHPTRHPASALTRDFDDNAGKIMLTAQQLGTQPNIHIAQKLRQLPADIKLFYYYFIQTLRFYLTSAGIDFMQYNP